MALAMTAVLTSPAEAAPMQDDQQELLRRLATVCATVPDPSGPNSVNACAELNQNDFNSSEFNGVGILDPAEAVADYEIAKVRLYFSDNAGGLVQVASSPDVVAGREDSVPIQSLTTAFGPVLCDGSYYAQMDYSIRFAIGDPFVTGTVTSLNVPVC